MTNSLFNIKFSFILSLIFIITIIGFSIYDEFTAPPEINIATASCNQLKLELGNEPYQLIGQNELYNIKVLETLNYRCKK